jgi:hypothetical protein
VTDDNVFPPEVVLGELLAVLRSQAQELNALGRANSSSSLQSKARQATEWADALEILLWKDVDERQR